jgi:putative ABC transport system permease protein
MTHWAKIEVPKGQLINLITAWEPGYHGIVPSSTVNLMSGSNTFEFKVKDSYAAKWLTGANVYPSSSGIVLNNEDYAKIKAEIGLQNVGIIHIINFKDWEKTESAAEELKKALNEANNSAAISKDTAKLFKPVSRITAFKSLKQGYSLFLFVTTIMGILFFIAAGSVLYFKQYTEINSAKVKFYKLYKLGTSDKEITGIISKELKLTFFVPLVLGAIMGYSFMYLMTFLVGGGYIIKDFMINATAVVVIYFLFQVVFYLITKRKYVGEILESL